MMRHRRMSGYTRFAAAGSYLALLACLAVALLTVPRAWVRISTALNAFPGFAGPVYTVADLERQIARDPVPWARRTVWVRGVMVVDHRWVYDQQDPELITSIFLADPGAQQSRSCMYLRRGPADPFMATLRRLPLLGSLAPRPQVPHPDEAADYRIQISAQPRNAWSPCIDAVLLDST